MRSRPRSRRPMPTPRWGRSRTKQSLTIQAQTELSNGDQFRSIMRIGTNRCPRTAITFRNRGSSDFGTPASL